MSEISPSYAFLIHPDLVTKGCNPLAKPNLRAQAGEEAFMDLQRIAYQVRSIKGNRE